MLAGTACPRLPPAGLPDVLRLVEDHDKGVASPERLIAAMRATCLPSGPSLALVRPLLVAVFVAKVGDVAHFANAATFAARQVDIQPCTGNKISRAPNLSARQRSRLPKSFPLTFLKSPFRGTAVRRNRRPLREQPRLQGNV
jgi:hypothetical protein